MPKSPKPTLVIEIYTKINARMAAWPRYPRLAAVNGVRVD
jgi:hypothetical protein